MFAITEIIRPSMSNGLSLGSNSVANSSSPHTSNTILMGMNQTMSDFSKGAVAGVSTSNMGLPDAVLIIAALFTLSTALFIILTQKRETAHEHP